MATDPANPFDYYERIRSRQARGPAATDDPVMATVASIRAQNAKRAIMDAPDSPDEAARVTRIARAVGEPPAMIEGRAWDYEKAQNADLLSNVLNVMPVLGQYFSDNPRALVAAQDDHKSVGLLGRTLEFFKGIPGALEAGYERTGGGLSDLYQSIDEAILPFTNPSGGRAQLDRYERDGAAYRARAEAARPQSDSFVVQSALQGVESIPGSLAALVVGATTRSPGAAASVMGLQTGAPAYREALRAGKDTSTALRYGFEQGAIEALTERLPAGAWLDALTKRTPAGQAILRSLATELPGEQVATVLQDFSTWATLTPDRPFSEYLAERPEAALRTAIATVTGTAAQVGATQVTAKTGDALVAKVREVRRARAHSEVLTRFEKAAAESKLRQRDGEAYAEMVGTLAAQSGIESVMVPAEAVREYMQSDGYDRFSDPFESYRDQVDEAFAVGGDVVLPADFALGTLPGTPAWSALRDDIRLTSGGMSPREAQSFDDAMADVVAEFETEMQAEYADLNAQLDAQGKLLQSVRDKLMNAGFTPYAAAQQAELIARRITTRAARMGQEVTGGEFTTEVRQVLPPELAKARAADATDLVINALRRGKDAVSQSGPSLLEWISKRGGINDTGGDLASMGLDQWHRGKVGRRKLLRKFDAQASMGAISGQGDYGVDSTLRAAIDEGFFPELNNVANEAGPSELDTQILLDAMSAELAGVKRYASEARVDGYRAAAAELDQMLTERGLDPAGMTDAELRAVIAQMDEAGDKARPSAEAIPSHMQRLQTALESALGQALIEREADPDEIEVRGEVNAERIREVMAADPAEGISLSNEAQVWASEQTKPTVVAPFSADEMADTIEIGKLVAKAGGLNEAKRVHLLEAASYVRLGEQAQRLAQFYREKNGATYEQLPDMLDIDGVMRPTTNSEGQPLASTEAGVRAFWRWFGASKVVDDQGKPLVVYHGTQGAEFDGFKPGSWFSESASESSAYTFSSDIARKNKATGKFKIGKGAEFDGQAFEYWGTISDIDNKEVGQIYPTDNGVFRYLGGGKWEVFDDLVIDYDSLDGDVVEVRVGDASRDAQDTVDEYEASVERAFPGGDGGRVYPVYLSLQNPIKLDALEANRLANRVGMSDDGIAERIDEYTSAGYDGIETVSDEASVFSEVRDALGGVPRQWVAFSPTQIKSINNRGTFDPNDARILMQSPREYYQAAYHGSPHIFDKFSLDKIGTGEGAQAFGWGLYFAGRKEIAEHYRSRLAPRKEAFVDGRKASELPQVIWEVADEMAANGRDVDSYIALQTEYREMQIGRAVDAGNEARAAELRSILDEEVTAAESLRGKSLEWRDGGRLYEVEIPDDDEYLLWDKPLSEQPEKVRAALEKVAFDSDVIAQDRRSAYFAEIAFAAKEGGDVEMATALAERMIADEAARSGPGSVKNWSEMDRLAPGVDHNAIHDIADSYGITGQEAYQALQSDLGSDRAASLALLDAGIAGIKYLDGGSRSDGDGSFNYVVFDDSRVSITAYEQAYKDGPRGRVRFEQVPVIELFQGRNLSTLLHELGHQYLEELRFDAETPDAPTQLVNDMETVAKWFAANGHPIVDGFIPVEAHEMWARGFERYLMEGKAPSSALARVFETLRGWMLSIYRKVEALRSPITPEIREVFDRLLATDEEIQATREQQALMPLFKDAAAVGMTGPEFEAYQAQFDEARVAANGEVLAKTMATIRRRVTAEYREQRAKVEEEVTARVDAQPLFKALRNLKAEPINADWLRDNMGEDVFSLLPKRVPPLWKDRGAHPDSVAEMSGYATGRQMVEALIGAELAHRQAVEGGDRRPLRVRAIQTETDAEMNAMVGDPLGDGTIEREALAAVNSEKQGEVMASELRAISRRTGQRPTPYKIARQWARGKVRQGAYNVEASPAAIQRHTRAVAKAGGEAERALMAGDFEKAFAAKQRQMLSSALLAEAKAAGDEVDAARKRLDKIARRVTSKSVDQDYLDQAHALLEAVDLRQRSQKSLDRKERFADWAAARAAEGFDVVVPVSFGETLGQTNWSRLPVETLLALDDAVAQVMHLGRLKQTLLDNQERREFDAAVSEAVETAGRNGDNLPPSDLMEPSFWERAKSRVAALDAALLKMETVFDWLDGGDPNGIFNRVVFRPIAEAQHNEQAKIAEIVGKLNDAANKIPAAQLKRWGDRFSSPVLLNRETGNPFVFTREQLISVALNFGNRGNIDKLLGGYGWNEGAVKAVLDENLTAEEWAYVQEVWDTIDGLWPEIEAMEKRLNGVAPERVEAVPVETPYGTMRGGYFPVVYDPARNYDAAANAAKNSDLFENIYTRATTTRGFTKARTEVQRPIHLSLGIINRHVAEVVHDLTHREAIMQADKFLSDKRVRRAVDEALGPEISKAFRPWLQRIANEWAYDRAGLGGFENFLRAARLNATIVGMGFRFSTVLMQAAGFSNSFEVVGERWVGPAIARAAANPIEAYNFVVERSGEVRARMDTLDRDIRDNMKRQAGGVRLDAVKRFAFHGIGYMDRVVVVPTWIGAYDKAIAAGMTEDQAIYAADKAVRQSQGSGAAKDLAAVQAGRGVAGEALKLLTMFYSYMSAFYQRQRTLGRDIGRGSVRDLPRHLARAWWLVIVPPVLSELLAMRGPDEDDDEEWGAWAFKKIALAQFGAIPVARDVMPILYAKWADEKTFGYRATPATGAIESLSRLSDELERAAEGEETKQLTRTSIETVGYFTGLTTGQIAATSQFLVDVGAGDADPQGLSDWIEGITTGRIKED